MSEIEVWKPVVGYEGLYEVSNLGNVRSVDSVRIIHNQYGEHLGKYKGRIRKPSKDNDGYLHVKLSCQCIQKAFMIHRLVAEAFMPNPDNLPEVNHINEDKTDNRVENLSWVSHIQNINHASRNQRVAETLKNRSDCSKRVAQYTLGGVLVAIYPSIMEVYRQKGYNSASISMACNNKRKSAYGYYWNYLD